MARAASFLWKDFVIKKGVLRLKKVPIFRISMQESSGYGNEEKRRISPDPILC
jgi:hypothetical protein